MNRELVFDFDLPRPARKGIEEDLQSFREFGKATAIEQYAMVAAEGGEMHLPVFRNEFWTSKQRAAHSLHEISYRACFKPQLPRFFIERLTHPGDVVYDPFAGRGTTLIEAALLGRQPMGCDVNPVSARLCLPRLNPPTLSDVLLRLQTIRFENTSAVWDELKVFYHPETLRHISALRDYLLKRQKEQQLDPIDEWIWMVALNRLTGHSSGFFSVYTMPPNQAVSIRAQSKINEKRGQVPPFRDIKEVIAKKTKQLLADYDHVTPRTIRENIRFITGLSSNTPEIPDNSVALIVTSPPFLDVVDYATDNWLRCWFIGVDSNKVKLTVPNKLDEWQKGMTEVFKELHRILAPTGHIAFEVGEVRGGKIKLEEAVIPCGIRAGLRPQLIVINDQKFTKTANCWGVDNNTKGTNTNRIVLFRKK